MNPSDFKLDIGLEEDSQVAISSITELVPPMLPSSQTSFRSKHSHNHPHHNNFDNGFQPVQYTNEGQPMGIPLSTGPIDLPSLKSNSRDKLSLLRLGLSIIPRLRSTHRFLLFWVVLHLGLGFLALSLSLFIKSLALSGFGYIVIFDAFGLFNILISEAISSYSDISEPSSSYPFGLKRFEVVFGFVNILYVLFAAINLIKEGIETLLLGEVHTQVEVEPLFDGFGPLSGAVVFLCCLMTFITAVSYRNHWQLSLIRFRKQSSQPVVYALWSQALNPFVLSTLVFGGLTISLLFNATFGLTQEVLDSIISLFQAGIIFYLTVPLALSFSMILLQSTPSELEEPLNQAMNEICSLPYVDRCQNLHVWQTTYGEYIGSLQVVLKPSESSFNYQAILNSIQAPWKKILHHCTVQVVNEP